MNVNRSYEKRQAVTRVNKSNTNTIEINGQLYDAVSGAPLQSTSSTEAPTTDQNASATPAPDQQRSINDAVRRAPKTSQLLMRSAVKKPDQSLKRRIKISESTDRVIDPIPDIEEPSVNRLAAPKPSRVERAALLQQSERINHSFSVPSKSLEIQPVEPVAEAAQPQQAIPATPPPKSPADLLLERGLHKATAHEQSPLKSNKSGWKRASLVAIPAVIVLALLVFGGRTFTNLQLRIASAKAGFVTNLPAYQPAGFTLDQMNYNSGIFASDFYAKNSNQSYTITQKSTSWSTQDLLSNYVNLVTKNYKTIQIGTRSIYMYSDGDATWVNGHIWYQIDSDGSLNESQIINIANSI